jgi:chemotaxis protein MotA
LLNKVRRGGLLSIEATSKKPEESEIFKQYPEFLKDHHVCHFVCDTMRMIVTGGVDPVRHGPDDGAGHGGGASWRESSRSPRFRRSPMRLPGLGIVAAVLGVVITMGALSGPPEELGKKVAAALVGTFLGILLCYGVVGPLSSNMTKAVDEEHSYVHMLRVLMLASMKGNAPQTVVEIARRAIPMHVRPTFEELEAACRGESGAGGKRRSSGVEDSLAVLRTISVIDCDSSVLGIFKSANHHHQAEQRSWRPSWRRVEGGLRRLRDRDDGAVHRALAA